MESNGGDRKAVVVVGYALPEKKVDSFITPSLLEVAQQRGIRLTPIDPTKPLLHQGPFHCIIHKLYSIDWIQQLHQYSAENPNVPIVDSPHAILRLHDRLSMLRVVSDLHHSFPSSRALGIPNQTFVQSAGELADLHSLEFPVIAKPMVSNGTDQAHQMYLVLNRKGLQKLKMEPPFVLQQFINHGGVIFKVYVAGDQVRCVTRNSLPDYVVNPDEDDDTRPSLVPFSQISNLRTTAAGNHQPPKEEEEEVAMPPESFVREVAMELKKGVELNLFNFDMIREREKMSNKGKEQYYIIDINYFPGYAKLPNFETLFTDLLLRTVSAAAAAAAAT